MNIGQAVVTASMTNGEPFMINAKDGAGAYQKVKKACNLGISDPQKNKKAAG